MKVEFNGNSYNIGNVTRNSACNECVLNEGLDCQCPADSEGQCILPFNKIYTDCCSNQVFKL
jgi:hypothetical protein